MITTALIAPTPCVPIATGTVPAGSDSRSWLVTSTSASSFATIVITASLPSQASAMDRATRAPASASSAAFSGVRL